MATTAINNGLILKNLVVKSTQQVLKRITINNQPELQKYFVETLPKGLKFIDYQDWYQGSSALNTDPADIKTLSGQTTTPKTGYEDFAATDLKQNGQLAFAEQVYATDSWSIDFTMYSTLLNDVFFDMALYIAVAREVEFKLSNALAWYSKQRLIKWYSDITQYCKTLTIAPLPATPDEAAKTKYYYDFMDAIIKEGAYLATTSGRSVLGGIKPNGAPYALPYSGFNKKRFIFVNAIKWREAGLFLKASLFNDKYAEISEFFEIIPVNFANWAEFLPGFATEMVKTFASADINFVIADEDWYQDVQQFEGVAEMQTGKLYTKYFVYLRRGSYRLKTEYSSICGDTKPTR